MSDCFRLCDGGAGSGSSMSWMCGGFVGFCSNKRGMESERCRTTEGGWGNDVALLDACGGSGGRRGWC